MAIRTVAALACLLCTAGTARAQDLAPPRGESWEGIEAMVGLLHVRGLRFDLDATAWTGRDPATQIVIVLGDTSLLAGLDEFQDQALLRFVDAGGALLFASDLGDEGNVLDGFLIRFGPRPVLATDPEDHLQEGEDCPILGEDEVSRDHPLFREALPFATNHPAYIELPRTRREGPNPKLRLAATFPRRRQPRDAAAFLLCGNRHQGREWRAIVMADHSVFINEMLGDALARRGIRNQRLTANVLDYLVAGDRTHVLVLYHGLVASPRMATLPFPKGRLPRRLPPGQGLALVNRFLGWIDDSRLIEDSVAEFSSVGDSTFETLVFVFCTITTPLVLFAVTAAGLRSRRRKGSEAWSRVIAVDPGRDPVGARAADLSLRGDHTDAIALAARRFFRRTGLPRPVWKATRVPAGWSRRRLRRALADLAAAADGRPLARADAARFAELRDWADRIERSLREGTLTLTSRHARS